MRSHLVQLCLAATAFAFFGGRTGNAPSGERLDTGLLRALDNVRSTARLHSAALEKLELAYAEEAAELSRERRRQRDERDELLRQLLRREREEADLQAQRVALERDRAEARPAPAAARAAAAAAAAATEAALTDAAVGWGGEGFAASARRAARGGVDDASLAQSRMFQLCGSALQREAGTLATPAAEAAGAAGGRDSAFDLILGFLRDADAPRTASAIQALPPTPRQAVLRELDFFVSRLFFGLEAAVFGAQLFPLDRAAFSNGPAMQLQRQGCAAAPLDGGRSALVVGGNDGRDLVTTELYDASTRTFAPGPYALEARSFGAAVALSPTAILVVGGRASATRFLNSTEVFSATAAAFSRGPAMLQRRYGCAAVGVPLQGANRPRAAQATGGALLDDVDVRLVVVVGGFDGSSPLRTTELLDIATMAFSPGPDMLHRREACCAALLGGRRVLVLGGSDGGSRLASTEILDLETMEFSAGPQMLAARSGATIVALDARRLLIVGGADSNRKLLRSTEVLDVETMIFSQGPPMPTARYGAASLPLRDADAAALVVGGYGDAEERALETTDILLVAPEDQTADADAKRTREGDTPTR